MRLKGNTRVSPRGLVKKNGCARTCPRRGRTGCGKERFVAESILSKLHSDLHMELGNFAQAKPLLEEVLKADPGNVKAKNQLAIALRAMPGCRAKPADSPIEAFLGTAWTAYKEVFIRPEGYVWDEARQEVTSEGQSYALLRAAWMGDRETFDRVFAWTEAHLARPDGLYSWQWTPHAAGGNLRLYLYS